jgi:hypothetical protein
MANVYMPLQLAPSSLTQLILPNWSFNLFSVNLGATSNAKLEQQALDQVGSYGKQIGHLAEALEVVIQKLQLLERAVGWAKAVRPCPRGFKDSRADSVHHALFPRGGHAALCPPNKTRGSSRSTRFVPHRILRRSWTQIPGGRGGSVGAAPLA